MHLNLAYLTAEALLAGQPQRWAHSQRVLQQAQRLAPMLGSDGDLVIVSAILHDIGYAEPAVDTGQHMIDGARYLARLGTDAAICSLVAYHSSSAWEAEELGLADALADFRPPPPPLLDAITFCDLTSAPDGSLVEAGPRLDEVLQRYGPDHVVHRAVSAARPTLLAMAERIERRLTRFPDQPMNGSASARNP
ncbi:HD domain-containing protein [Saccharothrix sp. ST-888]|uniref:HD domain-containing protein n=1 Tax=Saccharothrix sp. ST-888 TaxID=1427391 RepID=UPI0009E2B32A|nr:HD domain-containing protein [Saccharothrix sp. ST-888]